MEDQPISCIADEPVYDRAKEVKEFDETKAGVKGLADSGISKLPRFLIHPPENLRKSLSPPPKDTACFQVPVIKLEAFESYSREEAVNQIREASKTWGFFQMVHHGIPHSVLDNMLQAIRKFHEQPRETKMKWYSRDPDVNVKYFSNGDLYAAKAANWRDTLHIDFQGGPANPEKYPQVCREAVTTFLEHIIKLREAVAELISESLGLSSDYFASTECMGSESLVGNYYPGCPEPELTLGANKHSDPSFMTFLVQNSIEGLQVLHQDCWVDVKPVQGAILTNIGDLMQLVTNDKFKSVKHRVVVGRHGPRVTAACHFYPVAAQRFKPYGPIKKFICEGNPPIYRETHFNEYIAYYKAKGLTGNSALSHFKL